MPEHDEHAPLTTPLIIPLNRSGVLAYILGLAALVAGIGVLLVRQGGLDAESGLLLALLAGVGYFAGPELATALRTRYCLRADQRGICLGCWRQEVRIPWAAVARLECASPTWTRRGVQSLRIILKDAPRPGARVTDAHGAGMPGAHKRITVRGVFIQGDCHAAKARLDEMLARHGSPESDIPRL
ncbi:hypothetical protein [Desulfocurvus sp. DL9XJH121]